MLFGGNPDYWKEWREKNVPKPEPETPLLTVEFDRVTAWRFGYLCGAGFDPDSALQLAESKDVDLRKVDSILEDGCPHEVALRILL